MSGKDDVAGQQREVRRYASNSSLSNQVSLFWGWVGWVREKVASWNGDERCFHVVMKDLLGMVAEDELDIRIM